MTKLQTEIAQLMNSANGEWYKAMGTPEATLTDQKEIEVWDKISAKYAIKISKLSADDRAAQLVKIEKIQAEYEAITCTGDAQRDSNFGTFVADILES